MGKATRRDILKSGGLAGLAGMLSTVPGVSAQVQPSAKPRWEAPPKQKGNDLNLIILVSDTFRADNLAAYGSEWAETPYLNKFAEQSVIFESLYPEGMPTVPIRRQLYTGRRIFPTHSYLQQSTMQAFGGIRSIWKM
jgi:Sulfatase